MRAKIEKGDIFHDIQFFLDVPVCSSISVYE